MSDINERIKRIEYRIEKEYVFEEAHSVVVDMRADLVWAIGVIEFLEPIVEGHRRAALAEANFQKMRLQEEG